jgi:hypothetical protein
MSKIYIIPESGKYEGKLLVFDHVENMNHTSSSKIPQHPVESRNRGTADHRYKDNLKIQIIGNISDNWETNVLTIDKPLFQILVFKRQKKLREKAREELPEGSQTLDTMNKILDKEKVQDFELFRVPIGETYWIREAQKLLSIEKDTLDLAEDKELALESAISNGYSLGQQINTIAQANELLKYLDESGTLVTVVSIYNAYSNMVISSYSNPLRNGAQRGAFWVILDLEQQQVATTVSNPIVVSSTNSEEVNDKKDVGKKTGGEIDKNSEAYITSKKLFEDTLATDKWGKGARPKVTPENKEEAILLAANAYLSKGGRNSKKAATAAAQSSIYGSMLSIKVLR